MAIRGSDGSITLVTSIDDSGIKNGLKGLKDDFGSVTSSVMKITKTIGALGVAGAAAFGAIVKSATQSFAEYEQLVGGVDTLFKESSQKVQGYAADAYKTAGMSANEYMSTVTSFSASLLQSLGQDTEKAAEFADMAIIDMADNANKMGTDMQRIQDAYQGFAKQNYTMLDNLKLGYGGTKTEMERLIADANKLKAANGEMANLSINSFADVVEAIHTVQTEMGITGTTAKEASETIQGSVASMKASWNNLLTGIADENADLDKLMTQFGDSVVTVFENISPVVEQSLKSLPTVITKLGTMLAKSAPGMIGNMLPGIIQGGFTILETLVQTIGANGYKIGQAGAELAIMFVQGVISITPQLFEAGADVLDGFVEGLMNQYPKITGAVTTIASLFVGLKVAKTISPLIDGLSDVFKKLGTGIDFATMKQLLLNKAMNANVILAIVTAVLAAIAAYSEYVDVSSEAVKETKAMAEEAEEAARAHDELAQSLVNVVDSAEESILNAEAEAHAQRALTDELFALAAQEEKTAEDKERMKTIVDQLNESIDNLNLKFDDETGQVSLTKDAIDQLIQKKLELAQANAMADLITDYYKEQYKLEADSLVLAEKRIEALNKLNDFKANNDPWTIGSIGLIEYGKQLENLETAYNNLDQALMDSTQAQEDARKKTLYLADAYGFDLPETFKKASKSARGYTDEVLGSLPKVSEEKTAEAIERVKRQLESGEVELVSTAQQISNTTAEMFDISAQTSASGANAIQAYAENFNATGTVIDATQLLGDNVVENLDVSNEVGQNGAKINTSLAGGIEQGKEQPKQAATNVKIEVVGNLDASAEAEQKGIDLGEGYAKGIESESVKNKILTATGGIVSLAIAAIASKQKSNSPSKETKKLGKDFGDGYVIGIDSDKKNVEKAATGLATTALNAIQDTQDSHSPAEGSALLGEDFTDGFAVGIEREGHVVEDAARNMVQGAMKTTQDAFKDATTGLLDNFDPLANHQRYLDVLNEKGMKDSRERLWQNIKLDPKIWTSAMGFEDNAKIQIRTVLTPDMKQVLSKSAVTYKDGELVHQSNLYDIETKRLAVVEEREKIINSLNGKYAEEAKNLEQAYRMGQITTDEYRSKLYDLADAQRDQMFKDLEHEFKMDRITEAEYYKERKRLRDEYYDEGSDEWRSITEELYEYEKQLQEDSIDDYLDKLDYEVEQGIISEHDYYREIQRIRDNFFVKDSKEWRDYTKQLNEYRADAYEEFADKITEKAEELAEKENRAFEKMFSRDSLLEDKYTDRFASDLPLIEQKQTSQGREYYRLNSLRNRNQSLEKQYNLLAELKEREGMDAGLYNYMLSLSREESLQFAQILSRMGDEQFSKYIREWQEGQNWEQLLSDLYDDTTGLKKLADLEEDKKLIEEYSTAFKELQDRGISESFKAFIENLGVDEALETMSYLLDLSDEDFRNYLTAWEETEKLAQEKSKELYRTEAEELTSEMTSEFAELTKLFTGFGATSAIKFQQGFVSKINSIASSITSSLSNILPGFGRNIKNVIPYSSSILSGSYLPTNKEFAVATNTGSDFIGPIQPTTNNQASGVNSAAAPTTVVLEIDGREFGHAVLEYGGQESRRIGTTIGG